MKHSFRLFFIALAACALILTGCSTNEISGDPTSKPVVSTETGTVLPEVTTSGDTTTAEIDATSAATAFAPGQPPEGGFMGQGQNSGEPAVFASDVDTTPYLTSVSSAKNAQTYYDAADLPSSYVFSDVTVNLSSKDVGSSQSMEGLTVAADTSGNIVITNTSKTAYNIVLTGGLAGSVVVTSDDAPMMLTFNGTVITSTNQPALQLKSSTKTFLCATQGTVNRISDSADNSKKGAITSSGDVIFSGSGTLEIVGMKKHAVKVDGTVRMLSGTVMIITDTLAEGNGIHVDDAFIMDGGSLTINANGTVYGEEGKGIKVNGLEADTGAKGYLVINGGELTVTAVGKALTAGWKIDEDAETETTADDPTPNLIVNNGVITITTTGTVYEVSEEESLSPEGLEAKDDLIINGGYIQATCTDDALNAGKDITINGGMVFIHSSTADALDSNGTININGGTTIALGSMPPEMAIDCDDNAQFTYRGGTVVAMAGGGSNTPGNSDSTGHVITYGNALSAGDNVVLLDSKSNVIIAYTVPSYFEAASSTLFASSAIVEGGTYTISTNGTIVDPTTFNGLSVGTVSYTGGTSQGSLTVTATTGNIGAEIRGMMGGMRPDGEMRIPPEGFDPTMMPQGPRGQKPKAQ